MIYVTLPNFYENFDVNNKIILLSKYYKNYFKISVSFHCATGNFPYCYWNGGYNNNIGDGAFYDHYINCANDYYTPIRFNCANIFLKECDFDNVMANLILSLNGNGAHSIEIQDLKLYEYLKEKYPNYKYVFSKEAGYNYNLTPELINNMIEQKLFGFIGIPENLATDFDFLNKINNKTTLEIPINTSCNNYCMSYKDCKIKEHKNQYDYYGYNNFINCSKKIPYDLINPLITLEDIKEKYIPMGIKYFSLAEVCDSNELVKFFVKYFIKEEYQLEAYQRLIGDLEL